MADQATGRQDTRSAHNDRSDQQQLAEFWQTLRQSSPRGSRRDFLRWSAIAAGALATARFGVAGATSAPAVATAYEPSQIVKNAEINVPYNAFGQPVTLDPHRSIALGGFFVLFPNVWGGLVRYNEIGRVELDLAESYTKSEDGLTYTFKLRPDAKYATGNQVRASDFIESWKRALDPNNLSPMASFMAPLQGYEDYVAKKSDKLGIKAVDDATLQITLAQPYSYFLSYLAAFVWDVLDPAVLKAQGDNFALHDAGTGPWRFTSFTANQQIVMEPNPRHYNGVSPSIVKITWPIVTGATASQTSLDLYKADKAVSADVPLSLKSGVESDATLSKELVAINPSGFTRTLAMDFAQPPFNDVRVRRAFAMAVDRDKWCNETWQGTFTPTDVFTPPVVTTLSGYKPPAGIKHDPSGAKKLISEVFQNGATVPPITYYESSEDSADEVARWKALLQQFKDTLGIDIALDNSKAPDQLQNLQQDNGGIQFGVAWWQNITETAHLMSEVFRTDSPYMKGAYNWNYNLKPLGGYDPGADAKKFDELMAQADVEQNDAKRRDLYQQGEELVLKNAVCIPLGNWVQMYVQKPWLKGTKQGTWTGRLPVWFDKDVVVIQHGTPTPTATATSTPVQGK